MFHKAVSVQAKSTSVSSGWLREERSKLQIMHNHPEAIQLLIFLEEVGGREKCEEASQPWYMTRWIQGRARLIFILDSYLGNSQSAWPVSLLCAGAC